MAEKKIEEGGVLYSEGDNADFAYIVTSGKIELVEFRLDRESQIGIIEKGGLVGELAVFDPRAFRSHTARALENATLTSISPDEFKALLAQCPAQLQPFLTALLEKSKAIKTKNKAAVDTVKDTDIAKILVEPASEEMKKLMKPMEVPIARLPFKIGGYPENGEINRRDQLHLYIAAQSNPLRVSRQHCEVSVEDAKLIVTDLGSRFCTIVNGTIIGRAHGSYHMALKKGKNDITLGGLESPYKLTVVCE